MEILTGLFGAVVVVFAITLAILTFVLPFIIYGIRCHTKESAKALKAIASKLEQVEFE